MDQDKIKEAEARIATVQDALEHAQGALQMAERAHQAAEQGAKVMRTVALTALGGLIAVSLVIALHRHRHPHPGA
ncbi:MAG: hypothetical protein R2725_14385 [Solirubrobacterales bacterium]